MTLRYHLTRAVSIVLALGLWVYQTGILIRQAGGWEKISNLDLFGTIVLTATLATALVIADYCWHHRQYIKLAALTVLFALLIGGTLPQVIAKSGEVRDTKIAQAAASGEAKKLLEDEIARSRVRLDQAEAEVTRESRSGGCKTTCQSWQTRAKEVQARIDQLTQELTRPAELAPSDTVRVAGILGISASKYDTYQPLMIPLGIDFGIWALLWIGCSPSNRPQVEQVAKKPAALKAVTVPPLALEGPKVEVKEEPVAAQAEADIPPLFATSAPVQTKPRRPRPAREWRKPNVQTLSHDELAVLAALNRCKGKPVNNKKLARLMGVDPSEASRRITAVGDLVKKERLSTGEVQISLNQH
jgi:hypothetical protein